MANILNPIQNLTAKKKRKSDAADDDDEYNPLPIKKSRTKDPHDHAKQLVQSIISNKDTFHVPNSNDDLRAQIISLAQYARHLENVGSAAVDANGSAQASTTKSKEQIDELAERLRRTVCSQIKKQMTWKPSCKGGSAKWVYEGLCTQPAAFQSLMGLSAPPKWKQTKLTYEAFVAIIGANIRASIRYGQLRITSKTINVKWSAETGEFRFSGSYGL